MSDEKLVIVDFGSRHLNSLISLVHQFVPDDDIRLLRVTWPGKQIRTIKFDICDTQYIRNRLELKDLRESDSSIILTGSPDVVGSNQGYRSMSHDIYYEFQKPILAISYGHQLLCTLVDPNCNLVPSSETGRSMLLPHPSAMKDDILSDLPPGYLVTNFHEWAISKVPRGFHLLGETRGLHRVISIIKHDFRPIYSLQYQPEIPVPGYWAGPRFFKKFIEFTRPVSVAV
jgi:GMP synthase-like glutamine amidotransferase